MENNQNDRNHLIGPEYYQVYVWFVKVVALCSAGVTCVVALINNLWNEMTSISPNHMTYIIKAIVESVIRATVEGAMTFVGAFGIVTIVFAIIEKNNVKIDWKPPHKVIDEDKENSAYDTKLDKSTYNRVRIRRGDSLIGIVFSIIACVVIAKMPEIFSAVTADNGEIVSVPLFNVAQWGTIIPFVVAVFVLGIIEDVIKLFSGKYNYIVMVTNIICGVVQIIISVIILKVLPFWNPDFVEELNEQLLMKDKSNFIEKIARSWNADMTSNVILAFIIVFTLIEISGTLYKTIKYSR